MIRKIKTMQKQQSSRAKPDKLKIVRKLVIGVGYVWTLMFLFSALFRDEIHRLGWHLWTMYLKGAVLIIGFIIIVYYLWLSKKVKK